MSKIINLGNSPAAPAGKALVVWQQAATPAGTDPTTGYPYFDTSAYYTPVTSLELETDGTPNGSQTLLNLVAGSNVTLTDDGSGDVTIAASSGSVYYGQGYATAAAGNNTITLGSTPIANSVSIFVAGSILSPGLYSISGAVITVTGGLTSSATVVVNWTTTNSTPGGITLSGGLVSGMVLWLKADAITGVTSGNPISTWPDSSGNGNNATVASGTGTYNTSQINGLPAVTFSSCELNLTTAIAAGTGYTIFVVMKNLSTASRGDIFSGPLGSISYWTCDGGKQQGSDDTNYTQTGEGTAAADTNWHQMNMLMTNGGPPSFRINETTDAVIGPVGTTIGQPQTVVGYHGDGGGTYLDAQLAELIFYDTPLTLSQIEECEDYLSARYGI